MKLSISRAVPTVLYNAARGHRHHAACLCRVFCVLCCKPPTLVSAVLTVARSAGFGSTQPGGFGAPKPFGTSTSTGGSIFGGGTGTGTGTSTATSGGGFGSFGGNASSTQQTSTPFGGGANAASGGGSIFGGSGAKTGFGTASTPASGIFSQGAGAGFGATPTPAPTTSGPFGAPASTALGAPTPPSEGSGGTPFQAYQDRDGPNSAMNHYQSISFMQPYQKYTTEVSARWKSRTADHDHRAPLLTAPTRNCAWPTTCKGGGLETGATNPAPLVPQHPSAASEALRAPGPDLVPPVIPPAPAPPAAAAAAAVACSVGLQGPRPRPLVLLANRPPAAASDLPRPGRASSARSPAPVCLVTPRPRPHRLVDS